MIERNPYTYTTLRYVHDVISGEFINVGVVLHCPRTRFLGAKLRHTYGRMTAVFPDLDGAAFRSSMTAIERALRDLGAAYAQDTLFRSEGTAVSMARSVLPADDSSLQWSSLGSGLTSDPDRELEQLYERLVSKYDERPERRRSDEDVWRPVRSKLEEASLATKLVSKTIRSDVDELEFKHAWKNGVWHCYEALSFDLAHADSIKDKARRWTGHLAAMRDADEPFRPYFIVGGPQDRKLKRAYEDALAILKKSPVQAEVFTEAQADVLVARIEAEIRAHN